ncbi:hypothetical protein [Engelhardtia mirabilis]|uniref:Uncharacterized protein n=1 Tax=Engelhardtia mirabilis TaxID=2528011 RepID=A0A518BQ22_9BACT|nr:hypothetical protein Pla133_41910 [Planctomycetes bacterium Pla133]QDV03402.1 hypothetical protein Pla86_41900 [Planctomycetes bacterium Pla86]
MDFDDYWQENKGFVGQVAAGLVAFLIGLAIVSKTVGADVKRAQTSRKSQQAKLSAPAYSPADRDLAREDNEALRGAVEQLSAAVRFSGRPEFRDPNEPTTPERYLNAVARVRGELLPAAGRANVELDPSFGLPEISPTREDELERYLDGLDLVERVLSRAIEEGVGEVRNVRIRLDPRLGSKDGAGAIERTRVQFDLRGNDLAVLRVLEDAGSGTGRALVLDEIEMEPLRGTSDQCRAQVTYLVPRVVIDTADRGEG